METDFLTIVENFQRVEITEGVNGYPKNLHRAIICDTMQELTEAETALQDSGIDFNRCWIRKRDGWQLWENLGATWLNDITEMPMKESDFYLSCSLESKKQIKEVARGYVLGNYQNLNEYVTDIAPDDPENRKALRKYFFDFTSQIEKELLFAYAKGAKQALISFGCNNDSIDYTASDIDTGYSEDVWSNKIALALTE